MTPPARRQLSLDLPPREAFRREDLYLSPANSGALAALEDWRNWPGGKMVLVGPDGAGKTHLAHVWAGMSGAVLVPAAALAGADLPGLAAGGAVAVEDAGGLDGPGQQALFHLHNLLAEAGGRLLVTADRPPRDWPGALPDLVSRLTAAPLTRLEPPDDALLAAVLVKLFADRQLAVPPRLIPYLVARMDRSIGAARAVVAAIDAAALAERKPVSLAHAAQVLGRRGGEALDSGEAE